jgi:NADH:ubiquinone oxidoreductase subunit 2 (subunit N)
MLTLLVSSFGDLEQKRLKTFLAYSPIGHMGYTLFTFSTGTFNGMQTLFCYLLLYMTAGLCVWSIFLALQLKHVLDYRRLGTRFIAINPPD